MINHARTLLLNRSGINQSLSELGEEYIPSSYTAMTLPVWLRVYWNLLFGSSPENTYRNYVVDKLLRIVHATDYAGYLLYFDSRITYDPLVPGPFADIPYEFAWSRMTGTTPSSAVIQSVDRLGELVADEKSGVMRDAWNISMSNGIATITHPRTGEQLVSDVFIGGNISKGITLPGSGLKCTVRYNSSSRSDWDDKVRIEVMLEPRVDLSEKITSMEQQREHTFDLFGRTATEPYLTFFGLWRQEALPDKLAGLVLAMIYRMNDIWSAAQGGSARTMTGYGFTGTPGNIGNGGERSLPDVGVV